MRSYALSEEACGAAGAAPRAANDESSPTTGAGAGAARGHFAARSFTFYVAPGPAADAAFTVRASSLRLIRSAGFDFHAWLAEGIPFGPSSSAGPAPTAAGGGDGAGLGALFDALAAAACPVAVHNGLLDLVHIVRRWGPPEAPPCAASLTAGAFGEAAAAFAASVRARLPCVVDTKVVIAAPGVAAAFPKTDLAGAFACAAAAPCAVPLVLEHAASEGCGSMAASGPGPAAPRPHDAGADAYMTAAVLLAALAEAGGGPADLRRGGPLERHANVVHMGRMLPRSWDLTSPADALQRDTRAVLHLSGLTSRVRTADVLAAFPALTAPAAVPGAGVDPVSWLGGSSALLAFPSPAHAAGAAATWRAEGDWAGAVLRTLEAHTAEDLA